MMNLTDSIIYFLNFSRACAIILLLWIRLWVSSSTATLLMQASTKEFISDHRVSSNTRPHSSLQCDKRVCVCEACFRLVFRVHWNEWKPVEGNTMEPLVRCLAIRQMWFVDTELKMIHLKGSVHPNYHVRVLLPPWCNEDFSFVVLHWI